MKKKNVFLCSIFFSCLSVYAETTGNYTEGIFFLNEDWFGHTNSSLNFMPDNGDFLYRVYTQENPGEAFGCTAQFATIYGDRLYVVSKQAAELGDMEYIPGGRLVIADAVTLKKIKGINEIGGSDGRSFVGVNEKTAYIGTSNGIFLFDLEKLEVGEMIEGTGGSSGLYNSQIGMMLRAGNYVFAAKQGEGVLVMDVLTHTIHTVIPEENIVTLAQSKDGAIWAGLNTAFVKIDPYTLETEQVDFPEGISLVASWPAWNAGSLCGSMQENVLYFTNQGNFGFNGETVRKYYIDTDEFDVSFFVLPEQADEDGNSLRYHQTFYGAGLRVHPVSDELIITMTETGAGSHYQNNWVHRVNGKTGALIETVELNKYYWFPAMPFFPDNYAPEVNGLDEINVSVNQSSSIWLGDKVMDRDNLDVAIIKSVFSNSNEELLSAVIEKDSLYLTPYEDLSGLADIVIMCNSNGKIIRHTVRVQVGDVTGMEKVSSPDVGYSVLPGILNVRVIPGELVMMTDLQGCILYKRNAGNGEILIPLDGFSNGIYLLTAGNRKYKVMVK